jgi:ferredoxin-thioredoxin reductase catalytic subunit
MICAAAVAAMSSDLPPCVSGLLIRLEKLQMEGNSKITAAQVYAQLGKSTGDEWNAGEQMDIHGGRVRVECLECLETVSHAHLEGYQETTKQIETFCNSGSVKMEIYALIKTYGANFCHFRLTKLEAQKKPWVCPECDYNNDDATDAGKCGMCDGANPNN